MQVGIVGFGAYIPIHRLKRHTIGQVWGKTTGTGEKAVANWDEDSLTMSVEACLDSMNGRDRNAIRGILFSSTTPPYREKQSASLVRKVLDLRPDVFTADICDSLRGGTIGLRLAMDMVRADSSRQVLVTASDARISAPNSELELDFGDGAAALLIGQDDVAVNIDEHCSISSEFIDMWRRDKDLYTQGWEDRFILSEGYEKLMIASLKSFFVKSGSVPKDYSHAVIYSPNPRALRPVVKGIGLEAGKQVSSQLFDHVGNTGSAFALMMLVEVLEKAKPGDRILLASYGDGVDVFGLSVTEKISELQKVRGIQRHLDSSLPLENYGRYLRFRDLMEWGFDRRPPDRTSLPMINRESSQIYSLYGHKCRSCGTIQFPMQRVCTECQTKDDFEEIRLSDKRGSLFTFSKDERAMVPDLPNVICIVDLDGGGRFFSVMTDRDPGFIKIGMPVEMTFRRIHEGLKLYNYFWKTRPIRA